MSKLLAAASAIALFALASPTLGDEAGASPPAADGNGGTPSCVPVYAPITNTLAAGDCIPTPMLSGSAVCHADGRITITWTLTSNEPSPESAYVTLVSLGPPGVTLTSGLPATLLAGQSLTIVTQDNTGTLADATLSLLVKFVSWETPTPISAVVQVSCTTPPTTPTTVPTSTPTGSPTGTTPSAGPAAATAGTPGTLAFTGANVLPLLAAGLSLLAVGSAMVLTSTMKRRRHARS